MTPSQFILWTISFLTFLLLTSYVTVTSCSMELGSFGVDELEWGGREGGCYPTQHNNDLSFTCRGENITDVPDTMPKNITQL